MAISSSLVAVVGRWSLVVSRWSSAIRFCLTTNDQRPMTVLQILCVLRHLLARLQPHVRLLPIGTVAGKLAPPPFFPWIIRGAHRRYFHFEDRLYCFFDLGFRRLRRNLEN